MGKIAVDYHLRRFFLVQAYLLLLTEFFSRGKSLNFSSTVVANSVLSATNARIQVRKAEGSRELATTVPKTPSLYPTIHINKTWNCSDLKISHPETYSNTSIYVYYTDSDPYVCHLNPLHCKRPEQPVGGPKNSLTVYPKYGDYSYLPISQWILSLQHGAVVFLYHPCTSEENKEKLRSIARKCMHRHIVTPYEHLNITQPIAMVAWASYYADGHVNESASEDWIRKNAMKGPASYNILDGGYNYGLRTRARMVSDASDSDLCPKKTRKVTSNLADVDTLGEHYDAIEKHGHSSKTLKKHLVQKLKKQIRPVRHRKAGQAAWAVGSLLFLCIVLVAVLLYTKPWNERDYYLKEKMASRNNNTSSFSLLKSHLRPGGSTWRHVAEQQRHVAASRRLLGPIHEEEEDYLDL